MRDEKEIKKRTKRKEEKQEKDKTAAERKGRRGDARLTEGKSSFPWFKRLGGKHCT